MLLRLCGTVFASLAIAGIFGVLGMASLVHLYGRGLPGHEELVNYQPKLLSRVYSAEGAVIAEYATEQRVFIPIDEVPDLVKHAFISAEDKNFYTHPGVDALGIAKAAARFVQNRMEGRSGRIAGASTITQQVMKNFLLDNDRTIERKVKEAILAVRIDGAMSKDKILELYLNDIFFGARSYGIVSAARNYFDKRLDELEPHEIAYLAGLPKEPSNLHPVRNRDRAIARRDYVLREMQENGYLDAEAAAAARAMPLETKLGERPTTTVRASADIGYFAAEVRRQVIAEFGYEKLYEGGITVRATFDPRLQQVAGEALRAGLVRYDRNQGVWRGPVTSLEGAVPRAAGAWNEALARVDAPRDLGGWRLALVLSSGAEAAEIGIEGLAEPVALELNGEGWIGARLVDDRRLGKPRRMSELLSPGDVVYVAPDPDDEGDWDLRQLPEVQGGFMAMDPATGRVLALWGGFSYEQSVFNRATQALRQPGSAFKPFVYAAALDAGYTPATVINDAPVAVRMSNGETWRPKNSSGQAYGPTPLRRGLELSRNLMTVRIARQVGMDRVADYAERFGVYEDMPQHLSFALGAGETTLYDMVAAYGMFANGGKRVEPTVIDRVQDRLGNTLYAHDPRSCRGCAQERLAALAADGSLMTNDALPTGSASLPVLFDQRSQIMNPTTAQQIVSMMEGVVTRGTARRTVGGTGLPLAGKTGTTNDAKDVWFVGFSPRLVAGCFIGFDQPRSLGRKASGGRICGPVFKQFMTAALEGEGDHGSFSTQDDNPMLVEVKIDSVTGERLPDDAVGPNVIVEVFRAGTEPLLYAAAETIGTDAQLFGDSFVGAALPYSLDNEPESDTAAEPDSDRQRPRPAVSIGLGTGGLY